jgi:membrane protein
MGLAMRPTKPLRLACRRGGKTGLKKLAKERPAVRSCTRRAHAAVLPVTFPRLGILPLVTRKNANPGVPATLWRRGREERLAQAAGGLTFATVMSMVPLLAVSFALFTRVPALRATGVGIREHLLRSLLPAEITKAVLKYLGQFAGNASGLTWLGSGVLVISAVALLLSVENTLNRIWQVKKPRPLWRRLALYAGLLLAGPAAIGASLWATSSLVAASGGLVNAHAAWMAYALAYGPIALAAAGFACLFRFVPHTAVRWHAAIAGGLLAGIAFELGKRGFAIYLANVPTYRTIYGAFAPLLAFLAWVYYSWFITLAAALVSATLSRGGARAPGRLSRA